MQNLVINNLQVEVDGKKIIKELNLRLQPGEIHVIMGPNGSGKSTLSQAIIGNPKYEISKGTIKLGRRLLNDLKPDERAKLGIFLAWQYPREIEGVRVATLLKTSYEAIKKAKDKNFTPLLMMQFRKILLDKMKELEITDDFGNRYVNVGFSGGEKKKMEILQLALLDPQLAILDEIDSGLDIDALKIVSQGINNFHNSEKIILLITHYERLLKLVKPDFIHIMVGGQLVASGGQDLAEKLERHGYDYFLIKKKK